VFDTETTTDTSQALTFGAYRRCELVNGSYQCAEEGLFFPDDAPISTRRVLEAYVQREYPDIAVKSFPPTLRLVLQSRAQFIEKTFWKCVKHSGMIVGFNLPFDLSRLTVKWSPSRNRGWSLVMSLRRSRKTGRLEPNPHRPRVRITAKDSRSAFISLTRPQNPDEWPEGRFLDVHTLAAALFDRSYTLADLCRDLDVPGKMDDYEPTGLVTDDEIAYCRADVRATVNALNGLKQEFDRHPIQLRPDRAYSPASIAKVYLEAMGILPPRDKFQMSDEELGIAMQAYYGGRAECRVRHLEVPVIHTDFTSQYPTVNALLGNWDVLTAKAVSFDDATDVVRKLLASVTLSDTFDRGFWKRLSFFALVEPNDDVLPVRAVYNGETQNIGINYLRSDQPIWFAGPDLVASKLQTGRAPKVLRAIRLVPHGTQRGLKTTSLRGMVEIDPRREDFFCRTVEQRQHHKSTNEPLSHFLKTLGNSGSYGLFVEVTPEAQASPTAVTVCSGEVAFDSPSLSIVERPGPWYFPPLAALITAGGRLLLTMLERSVRDLGGTYLFCDTDSLCIVASMRGGSVTYRCGSDTNTIPVLSRQQVDAIAARFESLNPYNPAYLAGSILKIEKVNFDSKGRPRALLGFAISAKRYALYERTGNEIRMVDPKAHGLGYLYAPAKPSSDSEPPWSWEAWTWSLRQALGLRGEAPKWLHLPAMMRVVLSTPLVLDRLNRGTRPYNFLLCPLVDTVVGYPKGIDRNQFTLIAPFTKNRDAWLNLTCVNVYDGKTFTLALEQGLDGSEVVPQTFGYVLRLYPLHPESKSLAPDGTPCRDRTVGLLRRASVTAGRQNYVGKETDRRWEYGEDLSLQQFKVMEYRPAGGLVAADRDLRARLASLGIRPAMRRTGLSQHTLQAVLRGRRVRHVTLRRVIAALSELSP
jgi:hypothetical protein